jgi:hypothetical protein
MGASERLYHSQGRECGLGGLPGKRSRDWRKVCTPVFYVAAEDSNESFSLRIVRRLPACAQLSSLAEPDGQGLGNPRGRKPRDRADEVSRGDELWGFERRE